MSDRVLLLGTPRSWTSALGEAVGAGLGVPYLFEPLHPNPEATSARNNSLSTRQCEWEPWQTYENPLSWLRRLPETGWVVKELTSHPDAIELAMGVTEDYVDLILVTSRDPVETLCSMAVARATGSWLTPEIVAPDRGVAVTRADLDYFTSSWEGRRRVIRRLWGGSYRGRYAILPANLRSARRRLAAAGYELPEPERAQRVRSAPPTDLVTNLEEVRAWVADFLKSYKEKPTTNRDA